MSESKTPAPRIEGAATDDKSKAKAASEDKQQEKSQAQSQAQDDYIYEDPEPSAFERMGNWVSRTFPGHENAFIFGVIGFLLAIFIFAIGFFQTVFVAFLVLMGVAIGQQIDGDPKIINALRHLFSNDR